MEKLIKNQPSFPVLASVVAVLVVEGRVGDNNVHGWRVAAFLVVVGFVTGHHQEGQLSRRLPGILLLIFQHLLSACHVGPSLLLLRLGTFHVIDLVPGVLRAFFLLCLFLDHSPVPTATVTITIACSSDVKSSLGFGYHLSVLVLLQTDVLILELLADLGLVHRLGVDVPETFSGGSSHLLIDMHVLS